MHKKGYSNGNTVPVKSAEKLKKETTADLNGTEQLTSKFAEIEQSSSAPAANKGNTVPVKSAKNLKKETSADLNGVV